MEVQLEIITWYLYLYNYFPSSSLTCSSNYFTESGIYLEENVTYDLTSPNYPDDYPNDGDYDWKFRTSSRFIVINILDFETESGYDFVTIEGPGLELGDLGEGNSLLLTGTVQITRITSMHPEVRVIFRTDGSVTSKGFQMKIVALELSKYPTRHAQLSSNLLGFWEVSIQ